MKLDIVCKIEVPNVEGVVEMSRDEFIKFHEDLTTFYNENYEDIEDGDDYDNGVF